MFVTVWVLSLYRVRAIVTLAAELRFFGLPQSSLYPRRSEVGLRPLAADVALALRQCASKSSRLLKNQRSLMSVACDELRFSHRGQLCDRSYRSTIETVNSQIESMGIQRLHARSNAGRELKLYASLLALTCANAA